MLHEKLTALSKELNKTDELCAPSESKTQSLCTLLKDLYDISSRLSKTKVGSFEELLVDGLDSETIWEELQTRNVPLTRLCQKKLSKIASAVDESMKAAAAAEEEEEDEESEEASDSDNAGSSGSADQDDEENSGYDEDEDYEEEEISSNKNKKSKASIVGSDYDDEEENEKRVGNGDDDQEEFFGEMEELLDGIEEKEMNRRDRLEKKGKTIDDTDDEDENDEEAELIDALYEDASDEDDEELDNEDEEEEERHGVADYKYEDFFGSSKTSNKSLSKSQSKSKSTFKIGQKKGSIKDVEDSEDGDDDFDEDGQDDYVESDDNEEEEEDDDDDDKEDGEDDEEEEDDDEVSESGNEDNEGVKSGTDESQPLTSYQKKQLQIAKQIEELEKGLKSEKAWEMRGEVKGMSRPENSLLGINTEIERASKPTPVITQTFTNTIEEMIRQRITDGKFDDVDPYARTRELSGLNAEEDVTAETEFDLSQEKNKVGLGEIYAKEFLAKTIGVDADSEKTVQARKDAVEAFQAVSLLLDGLCHFHYTPKPVGAESSLKSLPTTDNSQVASLDLEDITPQVYGTAQQLAPQEIQEKKRGREGSLLSKEELTSEDKKRRRRANKAQTKKQKQEDIAAGKTTPAQAAAESGGNRAQRRAARQGEDAKLNEELKRDSRVTLAGDGGVRAGGTGGGGSGARSGGGESESMQYSKSSQFFSKLQQDAQDNISAKKNGASKKKAKDTGSGFSSSSLKL